MIEELLELHIKGFRGFKQIDPIPLDGDFVLVYGQNASGKSTILQALELALTGAVDDFKGYEKDYPRCLKHAFWSEDAQVKLRFRDESNVTREIGAIVGEKIVQNGNTLAPDSVRFFQDRCYLPQKKLARLIDYYRTGGVDQSDPPLVRFILEMLNMNKVENLTRGLHIARDKRRIERSCRQVADLVLELETVEAQSKIATDQSASTILRLEDAKKNVKAISLDIGSSELPVEWTVSVLKDWLSNERAIFGQGASDRLKELQQLAGELQHLNGTLEAVRGATEQRALSEIERDVDRLRGAIERRQSVLLVSLSGAITVLSPEVGAVVGQEVNLGRRHRRLLEALASARAEAEMRVIRGDQIRDEYERSVVDLGTCDEQLKALVSGSVMAIGRHKQRMELLQQALGIVASDECPVCSRDFGELQKGGLHQHVQNEVARLGGDVKAIEEALKSRAVLLERKQRLTSRISQILQAGLLAPQVSSDIKAHVTSIKEWEVALSGAAGEIQAWEDDVATLQSCVAEKKVALQHEAGEARARARLVAIAKEVEFQGTVGKPETDPQALEEFLGKLIETKKAKATAFHRIEEAIGLTIDLWTESSRLAKRARELKLIQDSLLKRRDALAERVDEVKRFDGAIGRARSTVINQVFTEGINSLWFDLFSRLARNEPFRPEIGQPEINRGRMKSSVMAVHGSVAPFDDLGAVLSSGNMNTAALSLFLTLHLVEPKRHRVIVLDDPVQNMDDVHVTQLTALLRAVKNQAGRQIVISVHEKAMFDYLQLELGPSRSGESLVTVEITKAMGGQESLVSCKRHEWKEDRVRFGELA